jgi:hypothetical protein
MDVRPGFENGYGDVGVIGEDDIIAGILQFNLKEVSNKELIFNDKNSSHPSSSSFLHKAGKGQKFNRSKGLKSHIGAGASQRSAKCAVKAARACPPGGSAL